jgi:hypothetical protein
MSFRRISGIILVIIGVGCIYLSHYINTQVAEGRAQISSAQKTTDTTGSLFSVIPGGKEVGKQMTGSVQNKIDEGTAEANQYAQYANWSLIGGVALIVLGIGAVVIGKRKTE